MPDLYDSLNKLAKSDMYPFHMPGHKRNTTSTPLEGAFRCDITEIDGFDNLHAAEGILLKAQERANNLYGADETYFLINGSTAGVLSAVSAVMKKGEKILAARGSHKSFYHGAYLRGLNVEYLPYKEDCICDIPEGYTADEIKKALENSKEVKAVFITSPTYEGKCSEIEKISKVCHERGIPLIVDAAHGAHFGLYKDMPESAVHQGADIVIHSLHKTLPSMTQTALLHVQGTLVNRSLLTRFLRIYQSSSPSYVLMASIDLCIKEIEDHREDFFEKLLKYREEIDIGTKNCKNLKVLGKDSIDDPAKIVISVKNSAMTGQELYDILREEYALQLEMAGEKYVLAIITGWDTQEGIDRLVSAICQIDDRVSHGMQPEGCSTQSLEGVRTIKLPDVKMSIWEAWDEDKEAVSLSDSIGRISGDFVNLYPPGIPIIAPGEVISKEIANLIEGCLKQKLNVQGLVPVNYKDLTKEGILCVKLKYYVQSDLQVKVKKSSGRLCLQE